jgi:hypothetical protein
MESRKGSELIQDWPEESREAAQLVIDTYGEPHEATGSLLTLAPRQGTRADRAGSPLVL